MRIPFLGENHSDIGGTKMKRIAAILLAVLALLLGACSVQRYSDAAMFCRRFNREYKESLLDIETATVTETDGCTVFSLTPDENILISLYTDSDGVRIKRISITAHGNVEEMQNGLFARFWHSANAQSPPIQTARTHTKTFLRSSTYRMKINMQPR